MTRVVHSSCDCGAIALLRLAFRNIDAERCGTWKLRGNTDSPNPEVHQGQEGRGELGARKVEHVGDMYDCTTVVTLLDLMVRNLRNVTCTGVGSNIVTHIEVGCVDSGS